jgi:hypothetical protein
MSHNWLDFSRDRVSMIARAVSSHLGPSRWRQLSEGASPEEEFRADGWVSFHLPGDFIVRLARKIVGLDHGSRWSAFLTDQATRQQFLAASNGLARIAAAREILLLPEATVLADLFADNVDFDEVKHRASQEWGPADLDISRIYTEYEVRRMTGQRVHYFLVNAVDP